ncbi:potassium channel subfamily T member 2-like isoform X2 [Convolutriloba macropyga]|uniref:potassium channel subfamily T member 2-like isoform X2 n=1 Tax=Convolutriloba macropyga TaxID=536237 RepID=UPI003F526050
MIQNTFKRVRDQRVRRTTFAEQKPEEMNGIRQQKQAWEQQQQTQDNQISTPLGFDRSITMRPTSQASGVTDQDSDDDKVRVEFFGNRTFKEHLKSMLLKNRKTAVFFRLCNLVLKSLSAIVYVVSLTTSDLSHKSTCYGCDPSTNVTYPYYRNLLWIDRGLRFYIVQTVVAYLSFFETLLLLYLEYRGNIWEQILSTKILFESVCSVPFIVSVVDMRLINLYVPSFLNCWLAKDFLEKMVLLTLKTSSTLTKHLINLLSFIFCLGFTCVCGINYLERTQEKDEFDLFNSFWFVMVTFSTVGYGDVTPIWWLSKLFVVVTICLALSLIPIQLEQISFVFAEHQKTGGTYSRNRAEKERHVVLVTSTVTEDLVRDFVSEFYAYSELQDYYVVLLSAGEYDSYIKAICENPICQQRVIYIQGSALRFDDLVKVKVHYAECCFVLASRHAKDQQREDEATILRAWSINDFASHCALYVQILTPESKVHVQFADYVICEEELKYALMASNCICPAMSTYISLLVHTLEGRDVSKAKQEWERLFGRSTAQEIYDKRVEQSKFFCEFINQTFTYAAMMSHRKYGCMLIGVRPHGKKIVLNPGPKYILRGEDTCYFFSITGEEETNIIDEASGGVPAGAGGRSTRATEGGKSSDTRKNLSLIKEMQRKSNKSSLRSQTDSGISEETSDVVKAVLDHDDKQFIDKMKDEIVQGFPTPAYQWFTSPLCHILKENKASCCLDLFKPCDHSPHTNALEYDFPNKPTIISVDYITAAIANFIVPLRHHLRELKNLSPIIIMTEYAPDINVLTAISCYPQVYYCIGKLDNLNDLFRAGISEAAVFIVSDRESSKAASESYLADSSAIVAVQTLQKLFPNLMIITELTYPTNMKFLDFTPKENGPLALTFTDKRKLERVPVDSDLFRSAFVSGQAMSPSMLDTLLYQSFVKPYIMSIVYLLIGLKQHTGSGHLIFYVVDKDDVRTLQTFGRLMSERLIEYGQLPIGMYRKQYCNPQDPVDINLEDSVGSGQQQQEDDAVFTMRQNQAKVILRDRLLRLGVDEEDINLEEMDKKKAPAISYVVVNPEANIELQVGDIIYLIQPPEVEW